MSSAAVTAGATGFAFSNAPATIQAGTTGTFTLSAVDSSGNVVTGYTGTVHLYANFPDTTFSADYTYTAADQGVHAFQFTPFQAGTQILWANDTVSTNVTGAVDVTCVAGPASQYAIGNLVGASSLSAGAQTTFGITAYDAYWNVATTYSGSAQITSSDPAAILPPNPQFTNGVVNNVPITFMTAGGQSVTATDTMLSSMTDTAWATVTAAPSAAIAAPSAATVGATGLSASVAAQSGATYAWSITNGTITAGAGTNAITFSVGSAGTTSLSVVVSRSGASSTGTASVNVVPAPQTPTIAAQSPVTSGGTGYTASVVAHAGMTYRWTITGGTITSAGGTAGVTSGTANTITYTAGAVGTIALTAVEVNAAGAQSASGTASVTVVAGAVAPVITAPAYATVGVPFTASVPVTAGVNYTWTVNGASVAATVSGGASSITYTASATGTLTIQCTDSNGAGSSASATKSVTAVAPPTRPTITAASPVTTGTTGHTASVTAHTGMTYRWTIGGGTITSSGGTKGVTSGGINKITYTAGPIGTITITCVEVNAAGTASAAASATVNDVAAAPVTPTITAASPVTSGVAGYTASVVARSGMTYAWTITGGTITSAGGAAGVTNGGTNTITYTAGAAGTIALTCAESNGSQTSTPASKSVTVVAPPTAPVISAPAQVTSNTSGLTASLTAAAGTTYTWSITNGTISGSANGTTSGSTNTLTFTSGSVGSMSLQATATNAAGTTSAPGTATITVTQASTPPVTPSITTASPITSGQSSTASVTARNGMTYTWTISGGTITSAGGPAGVTAGGTNTITFTAGAAGTLTLTCAESNGAQTSTAAVATVTVQAQPTTTNGHLYVVAHEDDDLLFMNPDIERSIRAGHPTRVVFLTAAGSPDTASWQAREHGCYTPYMAMANATYDIYADSQTYYTCGPHTWNGIPVQLCTLTQNPLVSLVFMRLPDGSLSSIWQTDSGAPFYVTPAATLTTADGANTYTKSSLIATLAAIIGDFAPARIGTLDSTFAYGDDHQDHVTSALLMLEAMHQVASSAAVDHRIYRGYSMDGAPDYYTTPIAEPVNLSTDEYNEKHAIMVDYGGDFPNGGTFDNWCHRRYVVDRVTRATGPIVTGGNCLDVQGTQDGTPVSLDACTGAASQTWTITPDFQVMSSSGKCLTVGAGGAVSIATCAGGASQRWSVFANGQVRGQNASCLEDDGSGGLVTDFCGPDTSQSSWKPLSTQTFALRSGATFQWSTGTNFSDADVGSNSSSYRTLSLVDVNGDRWADACIRLSGGLFCGTNDAGALGAYAPGAGAFSDSNGWSGDAYGSTVQLADVNGDGTPDVCGRSASGIQCGLGNGTGSFASPTQWTAEFSDATVFAGPAYYRSIHFADVNGDGYADVCGRSSTGIVCALNSKQGAFAPSTAWDTAAFTDASGWSADAYASTVELVDVDGDHLADVCGRGPDGIHCAISNGTQFIYDHLWSFRTDFSDAAGWNTSAAQYDSIHFGDVNGDGLADVCGRNASGVWCAPGDSVGFEQAVSLDPDAFTDAQGWSNVAYGASVQLADVNHDGRSDVCGRSSSGLVCSLAP